MRYAGERRDLAESIAELREIADGRNYILAEAAGITAGSWYACRSRWRPSSRWGVVAGRDRQGHRGRVRSQAAVVGPIRKRVAAVEVGIRPVGEGTSAFRVRVPWVGPAASTALNGLPSGSLSGTTTRVRFGHR